MIPRYIGPEGNSIFYLLLCSIIHPAWDTGIFSNLVNSIEHPVLEQKKREGKRRNLAFGPNIKNRGKLDDVFSGLVSITELTPKSVQFGSFRAPDLHYQSVALVVLYLFVRL